MGWLILGYQVGYLIMGCHAEYSRTERRRHHTDRKRASSQKKVTR